MSFQHYFIIYIFAEKKQGYMSISVDTINLRFNVKPNYDQQQLQQLQQDLKNGQSELEKTRKGFDCYS